MGLRLLIVVLLIGISGGALWLANTASAEHRPADLVSPAAQIMPAPVAKDAAVPASPQVQPAAQTTPINGLTGSKPVNQQQESATAWLARVSAAAGIPERALRAYVNADLTMRQVAPNCHLAWTTLAGIGRIESNNGYYAGAQLAPNGDETKPIIGVPLDGSPGIANLPATDGGKLDGDTVYAHAVGPMQFLPSTWQAYASDGNGDGVANPQNIDDATVAAGRYLCAGGKDLATPAGWWAAVLSYNPSTEYGQKVFAVADAAAKASLGQ